MGAHPKAPSSAVIDDKNDQTIPLNDLVSRYPEPLLGAAAARTFGDTLPFLFKVLAAAQPLSIQAHPGREMAKAGFERENRAGIPLDAPHRNYRDPWPKPEIICAVAPFVALNGFRPARIIAEWFETLCPARLSDQVRMLRNDPGEGGIKAMFESLVRMGPEEKKAVVETASGRAAEINTIEGDWVARLAEHYPGDIGVLCPLYLNLFHLEPYTAMFLAPGQMHAYLEGVGIELMANSDNVLRGGLTGKHVDTDELMRVVRFDPSPVEIITPVSKNACERIFPVDADEFALSVVQSDGRHGCAADGDHGFEILLCMEGSAEIRWDGAEAPMSVGKGESFMVPACTGAYEIFGEALFFKASVPVITQ